MCNTRMRTIIFYMVVIFIPLMAENINNTNIIKGAKIIYNISGGGILTLDNNLSIEGIEELYIKNSGEIQFHTLKLTESIEGSIKDNIVVSYMHRHQKDTMYDVDFRQKVIVKYINTISDNRVDLTNLEQSGTEIIATYSCDIWKNLTKKICLYRGVPLLIEKNYLGFVYIKRARFVLFDSNVSDEFFELPDFPIKENIFLNNGVKTTKFHKLSYFYEKILEGKEGNVSKSLLYTFTDDMVKRQKEKLPIMLQDMKETRECLSLSKDQVSANICIANLSEGQEFIEAGMWSKEIQNKIMDNLEENILKLESHISCIKRVENIDDLSNCMSK